MDFSSQSRETGRVADNGRATFREYTKMIADRPPKFSADQVGYRKATSEEANDWKECEDCQHFYRSDAAERNVCEIFRPDGDENVDRHFVCDWFTDDGVRFPLRRENE